MQRGEGKTGRRPRPTGTGAATGRAVGNLINEKQKEGKERVHGLYRAEDRSSRRGEKNTENRNEESRAVKEDENPRCGWSDWPMMQRDLDEYLT